MAFEGQLYAALLLDGTQQVSFCHSHGWGQLGPRADAVQQGERADKVVVLSFGFGSNQNDFGQAQHAEVVFAGTSAGVFDAHVGGNEAAINGERTVRDGSIFPHIAHFVSGRKCRAQGADFVATPARAGEEEERELAAGDVVEVQLKNGFRGVFRVKVVAVHWQQRKLRCGNHHVGQAGCFGVLAAVQGQACLQGAGT